MYLATDKIYGLIYGNVIGDIIGFLKKNKLQSNDKENKFIKLDWSSITDKQIVLMNSFSGSGEVNVFLLAENLKDWAINGLDELGPKSRQISMNLNFVLNQKNYTLNPIKSARNSYKLTDGDMAQNDALTCNAICGIFPKWYKNAILHTISTTYDSRCIASSLLQSFVINCLFYTKPINWKYIYKVCIRIISVNIIHKTNNILQFNNYWHLAHRYKTYLKKTPEASYAEFIKENILPLDNEVRSYCLTSMALIIIIVIDMQNEIENKRYPDYKYYKQRIDDTSNNVYDIASNCAIVGSVIGVLIGSNMKNITTVINNKEWLDIQIDKFCSIWTNSV